MYHYFNVEIAQKYGVSESIFCTILFELINNPKSKNRKIYVGKCWIGNTHNEFREIFPYWSTMQLRRIIGSCKENNLIIVECFHGAKFDQTNWYTVSDIAYKYLIK